MGVFYLIHSQKNTNYCLLKVHAVLLPKEEQLYGAARPEDDADAFSGE